MVWLPLDYRKKTAIDFQKLNFQFTLLELQTDTIPSMGDYSVPPL